jgi:hypothetical protein
MIFVSHFKKIGKVITNALLNVYSLHNMNSFLVVEDDFLLTNGN